MGDGLSQVEVGAGDVLRQPPRVPHKAEALEETLEVVIFRPPPERLDHTDDYFKHP